MSTEQYWTTIQSPCYSSPRLSSDNLAVKDSTALEVLEKGASTVTFSNSSSHNQHLSDSINRHIKRLERDLNLGHKQATFPLRAFPEPQPEPEKRPPG